MWGKRSPIITKAKWSAQWRSLLWSESNPLLLAPCPRVAMGERVGIQSVFCTGSEPIPGGRESVSVRVRCQIETGTDEGWEERGLPESFWSMQTMRECMENCPDIKRTA